MQVFTRKGLSNKEYHVLCKNRRAVVFYLKEKGSTYLQISEQLKVSRTTVFADFHIYKKQQERMKSH